MKTNPLQCAMRVTGVEGEGKWRISRQCQLKPVVMTPDGSKRWCKRHAPKNPTVIVVPVPYEA